MKCKYLLHLLIQSSSELEVSVYPADYYFIFIEKYIYFPFLLVNIFVNSVFFFVFLFLFKYRTNFYKNK